MSAKRFFQSAAAHAEQPNRRAYVIRQICEKLQLPRRTFFHLRATGQLPFLEEIQPRLGRVVRYRADLVDTYLAGQWGRDRHVRQLRAVPSSSPIPSSVIPERGNQ